MIFNSYIYLYHLNKFCVLPDYPESLSDTMGSTFAETNALARTAPVFSYQNSGPRNISTVSLRLHRDMMEGLNFNVSNLKEGVVDFTADDYVDTLIKYLQAAAIPKYNEYSSGSKAVIPPMVALRFGNDIFIKGVINSTVQCTYQKPILWNDKYAVVDIGFSIYETDPYDAAAISEQGSFRGITRTFKDGIYSDTVSAASQNSSTPANSSNGTTVPRTVKTLDGITQEKKKTANISTTKHKFVVTGVE